MNLKKLGKAATKVLGTVAPTVARMVGGPFGGIAGAALEAIFPGESESEIERKIAEGSPETLLKLRQAEDDTKIRLRELDIREEEIFVEDTQHARASFKTNTTPQLILTAVYLVGYFGLMAFMLTTDTFNEMDAWQKSQLGILIGVLTAGVVQIMNFWFGTSKGSKDKVSDPSIYK